MVLLTNKQAKRGENGRPSAESGCLVPSFGTEYKTVRKWRLAVLADINRVRHRVEVWAIYGDELCCGTLRT